MNETNIGNSGLPKQNYNLDISQVVPASSSIQLNFVDSTIAASELSIEATPHVAGAPRLQPPVIDPAMFLLQASNTMAQIASDVAKGWAKSVAEIAEQIKREINSPAYLARQEELHKLSSGSLAGENAIAVTKSEKGNAPQDGVAALASRSMWLDALSAVIAGVVPGAQTIAPSASVADRNKDSLGGIAAASSSTSVADLQGAATSNSVSNASSSEVAIGGQRAHIANDPATGSGAPQFIAQSLVAMAADRVLFQDTTLISSSTGANSLHAESNVVQDAWKAISAQVSDPATLMAGWFSAMWGVGLVYQMSAEKIATQNTEPTGGKAADMNFAKNYASKILAMIDTPRFSASLQAMLMTTVSKAAETDATAPNFNTLISKAKLVLLSLALALVTKLEVGSRADEGWINEMEFNGMLNGTTDLTKNDLFQTAGIKQALIAKINVLLASLDPADRAEVRASLSSYMASNPSVEKLLDQQTAIDLAVNPPTVDEEYGENLPV